MICLPNGASPPVIDCTTPILTVSCAHASPSGAPNNAKAATLLRTDRLFIHSSLDRNSICFVVRPTEHISQRTAARIAECTRASLPQSFKTPARDTRE